MKSKPHETEFDQTNRLIQQTIDEAKIESKMFSPEEEIARRLAKLRDEKWTPVNEDRANILSSNKFDVPSSCDQIWATNEQICQKTSGKQKPTVSFDENFTYEEIDQLLAQETEKAQTAARVALNDKHIQAIMKLYNEQQLKKTSENETGDDKEFDEQELANVIKEALMQSDDEETEIENM